MDFERVMNLLRSISSGVCNYLDGKLYLLEQQEDNVSDQYIINECYAIVIRELNEMGIEFFTDLETLMGNFYDAECLYLLRKAFSPRDVYMLFKSDTVAKDKILCIFDDSNIRDFSVVEILEYLKDRYADNEDYTRMYQFFFDKIKNNDTFVNQIEQIAALDEGPEFPEMNDDDSITAIMEDVNQTRIRAEQIFKIAMTMDDDLDGVRLMRDLRLYNLDKLTPQNINKYAWWIENKGNDDSGPKEDLPEELKAVWWKYHLDHNRVNNHHIEYYEARPHMQMVKEDFINLLANCFEAGERQSIGEIKIEVQGFYDKLITLHDIPDDVMPFIDRLLDKIKM